MIGLIFGETSLPIEILKKIKKKKIKYLIVDLTKSNKFRNDKNSYKVSIGQFGKIIKILNENRCKKVIFAGKVSKPNFSKLKLDLKGIYYIPRIIKASKLGDAAILKEIIKILNEQKIKTLNSLTFNPELTLRKGNYTKLKPNNEDKKDIIKAIKPALEYFPKEKILLTSECGFGHVPIDIVKNKIKNEITLKIENNFITSSLKTILNNFDIEDLFINEPPIDEVIGKVLIKKDYDI